MEGELLLLLCIDELWSCSIIVPSLLLVLVLLLLLLLPVRLTGLYGRPVSYAID